MYQGYEGIQIEPGVMQYDTGYRQGDRITQPQGWQYYNDIFAAARGNLEATSSYFKKSLTSTDGTGGEFIPTPTSAQIIKFIFLDSWARQAFGTFTIPQGQTITIPKDESSLGPANPDYIATENTDTLYASASVSRQSTDTTSEVSITLRTIQNNIQIQRKFAQYNILSPQEVETWLREKIVKSLTESEEDAFVNGDTTSGSSNINNAYDATNHLHGQNATNNEHLIIFNGLRVLATAESVDVNGSLALTDIDLAIANLGKYGVKKGDLILLTSIDGAAVIRGFSQVETLEKYGPRATVLTGEVMKLRGMTVIEVDKMPTKVGYGGNTLTNSTGIRSSSLATNTKTELLIVNKNSPILAVPANADNALSLEMENFPGLNRKHLWAREDIGFNVRYPDAIVRLINITPLS